MKILLLLAASLFLYHATAQTSPSDSLSASRSQVSFVDFLHDIQQIRGNASGRVGAEKAVFDIYLTLSDERLLLEQQIIRKPCKGRYVLPQTAIEYGFLPADSTFSTTLELFLAEPKNWLDTNPRAAIPQRLRQMEELLNYADDSYRARITQKIQPFYPETIYPPDSVLYLNYEQERQLKNFFRERYDTPIGFTASDFSIKRGSWGPIINRPIIIVDIIFEESLQRAYVNAQSKQNTGWGILMERTTDGQWRILEARTRYFIVS